MTILTFNKIFKHIVFALKIIGITINEPDKIHKQTFFNILLNYYNIFSLCTIVLHLIFNCIIYTMNKDLKNIFFILPCISYSSLGYSKLCAITYNKKIIENLLLQYNKYNSEYRNEESERVFLEFERRQIKFLKKIMIVILIVNGITLGIFYITPLALMTMEYLTNNVIQVRLIFPLTYPLNPEHSYVNYLVIYAYQAYAGIINIRINIVHFI